MKCTIRLYLLPSVCSQLLLQFPDNNSISISDIWSSYLQAIWAHQVVWLLPFSPSQITFTPSYPHLRSPHWKERNYRWTFVPCVKEVPCLIPSVTTILNAAAKE